MAREVGGYVFEQPIGQGASGTVYVAFQPDLQRYVAIKELSRALVRDPEFLERFRREARTMAALDSAHCVRVFDFFERPGEAYLVTELIDGATLREVADKNGPLTPEQALYVLRGALLGLIDAHALGLVHLDIKPANILCDRDGVSKLGDFGLAERSGWSSPNALPTGSPLYASPEQATGGAVDARSDVYACGAMLFELLTGRPPYVAETALAVLSMHASEPVPDPRTVAPRLPGGVAWVVIKAMAKNPAERFQTAAQFLDTLDREAQAGYGADWQERGSVLPLVAATIAAGAAAAAAVASVVVSSGAAVVTSSAAVTVGGTTVGTATAGSSASTAASTTASVGAKAAAHGSFVSAKAALAAGVVAVTAAAGVVAYTLAHQPISTAVVVDCRTQTGGGIYTVNPISGVMNHVSGTVLTDIEPSVSPDGKHIAFVRVTGATIAIWVVDYSGGTPARLTTPPANGSDSEPVWSPDGSQIAYLHTPSRGGESPTVYIMQADGSGQHPVVKPSETFGIDYDIHPTWSPDGRWIAFAGTAPGGYFIFWVHPDGTGLTHIPATADATANALAPVWSPDGRKIAFLSLARGGSTWVMDSSGSNPVFLFQTELGFYGRRAPAWSPDAGKLAVEEDVGNATHIFVMSPDGTNPSDITKGVVDCHDPGWATGPAPSVSVPAAVVVLRPSPLVAPPSAVPTSVASPSPTPSQAPSPLPLPSPSSTPT